MDGSVAALRRALETTTSPPGDADSGPCALCDCSLASADAGVVEVSVPPDGDGPAGVRICPPCYEHLVGDLGVAPLRVSKFGPRRRVVLPVSSES